MTARVPLSELHSFGAALLGRLGVARDDALAAADVLCYADARGLTTHGTGALATIYGPRLLDGRIDAAARPVEVLEQGAVAVLDARRGLGLVAMTRAMERAVRLAGSTGIAAVAVRDSSHFGAAGYYAHCAAQRGFIGIALTNCGKQGVVPPLGGALRLLGTNPIGAAVPTSDAAPFVLDMSTTAVASGKIAAARRAGSPLPPGWLGGPDGADSHDPEAYFDGRANLRWLGGDLATGGAKGFGLGLLVDLLCGPLAGASWGPRRAALDETPPADDEDIGHLAIAIDPAPFVTQEAFLAGADELLSTVRASPPAPSGPDVTYPGEPEMRRATASKADGAEVPSHLLPALLELADRLDVQPPSALTGQRERKASTA